MWKNIAETNIMVGTHADSLIAEAVRKNITGFDTELAWDAVWKDATVPPLRDSETVYADREEVRAASSSLDALGINLHNLWIYLIYSMSTMRSALAYRVYTTSRTLLG